MDFVMNFINTYKDILLPVAIVGGMGLVFGALLGIASKIFAVKTDERIPKILEVLPGANCGGCGFAGCSAYAGAICNMGARTNMCPVGGDAVAKQIADIMGVEAEEDVKMIARVQCRGCFDNAKVKYIYDGAPDCRTAANLSGGPKMCNYGCLGLGSCAKVCKFGAIRIENGLAVIDPEKCVACGACARECPRGIIKVLPANSEYLVSCKSRNKGKFVKENCSAGCIGCGICAKTCPNGAIEFNNNIAVINPALCVNCGACAAKCPQKAIAHITD